MMPPPSSQFPPQGSVMYQNPNMLTQQMQDMRLGPPLPQGATPPVGNPNKQQMPPTGSQQFPSPQHRPISTQVTYSSQPRATYPYVNNNPPGNPSSNFPQPLVDSNQHNANNIQTEHGSKHVTNGISNGHHTDAKQNMNSIMNPQQNQGYSQSAPMHQGMRQMAPSEGYVQSPPMSFPPQSQSPPFSQQTQSYQAQVKSSMSHQGQGPSPSSHVPPSYPPQPSVQNNLPQPSPNQRFPVSPQGGQGHAQMYSPPIGSIPAQNQQQAYQSYSPQSVPAGFPPMGSPLNTTGSFSPGSPQFSGLSPNQMNYQSQQIPGGPQPTSPYPYASSNQGLQQQPRKLDLDQMPSVVQVREEDKKIKSGYFCTDIKGQSPPLVTTNFTVQDRGMCSPRFIRSSVYCLPNHPDILKQTAIPFAITISPLASVEEDETEPPLALYREQGPVRCKRCKAYICPFMNFIEGGRAFQCSFCKVVTEVPQDYFSFLDGMGERTDKYHRPELCLGSYEYIATKEYCRNDELPNPPAYIFMIEVSNATFRNGLVPLLCENLKSILQCLQNDEKNDASKLRVGFVTYNNVLHFYNLKKNLTQPHIMVLSDVHNAFVPLLDGFLVTLSEAEALVECLMEHIPRLFVNEPATEIILGPVIQVGLEALKNANCSGKLLVFHSTIPNADAPGKLPHREGQKLLGTDKQKSVLTPQNDFYSKLAQDCIAGGCAVDLFLFPNAYVDIASLTPLCRHTGGQMYKYTYFQSHIDGDRFLEDLERNITTTTAFDAVLRVRTSAGISPIFYYGNFYMSNATDVELSAIDCHKSITVEMAYDEKLPENETVYIQAALLYTTCNGERRIRVHNLALSTSVGMPDVFKCCELDTIVNFFAKQALKQVLELSPQQIKNNLVNRSVKILSCYRKHCASSSSSGQLILPDPLKLLPVYINCLLRSDAISGGSDMSLDDRSFAMLAVNSMGVKSTAIYFYPTLIPLHEIDPNSDELPVPVRCSIEKLNDTGAYLLENGIYMFLWIGQAINPEWLQNVFGVQSTNHLDKQKTSLPELNTPLSQKIRRVVENIEEGRQWYMRLTVMVQGDKLEVVFRQFLVEDRGSDGNPSYVDFLCHLHREISKNL
ncbi:protein transport protein Sec24D-like [Uloborus diversus]|uniref:protein transport protein Sec24D-like n=1 Tax=Uloborus diversus TaxID=327109 RepID=UPI00240A4F16|nr:protein transport protein Sec24D-like [Uloborus diversus]XP_054707354.1 protein transport protein Sec24D-like [Uloborus diversus]XP_054707355.1 protein transport protein Sec24D-like [Uloborus diversus]